MVRQFDACKQKVDNRGRAPDEFLNELIDWGRAAPEEIFKKNDVFDIYSSVAAELGPWRGELHRRAVMLEVLRVLGGFESSWDWSAGRDIANPSSNTACTEEAGIFQCSGNSMSFSSSLRQLLNDAANGDVSCQSFISTSKQNHKFAIEYCARLIRFTTKHHGPIKYQHINLWLRKDSVEELFKYIS